MSGTTTQPAATNTNQAATTDAKPAGQEATATKVTETPKAAAPAAAPAPDAKEAPKNDPAPNPSAEQPKADQAKPSDEVKYELKAADGKPLDDVTSQSVIEFAKKHGLSNEQAQAHYESRAAAIADFTKDQENQFEARRSAWMDQIKKDPEVGGELLERNLQITSNLFKKFADQEFAQVIETAKLGSHPGFVKFLFNIAKAVEPKSFVPAGAPPTERKTTGQVLYDHKTS